ncbi:Uncharacterised protein g9227 [Pycnogonum litorale]
MYQLCIISIFVICCHVQSMECLKCYNCNNCLKYDRSQAVNCIGKNDVCVRKVLRSGVILRECEDPQKCKKYQNQTERYKEVICCKQDECNMAPIKSSVNVLFFPVFWTIIKNTNLRFSLFI